MSRQVPLSRGFVALVDDADFDRVIENGPWHVKPGVRTSYASRNVRGSNGRYTTQTLHQFITDLRQVDHVNGDGLDNRRSNLRPASMGQNAANRPRRVDSSTPYKGVQRNASGTPWRAQICVNGRKQHLGLYATAEDAANAYDQAALSAWGPFARLNFQKDHL